MIRVLITDDSPTLRQLVRIILEEDPELEVVGEAQNGLEALDLCNRLDPDIVTMDIQMPRMNGFEAIQQIMAETPRPIVVLTSTASDAELNITYKGVEAGALMVIGKPEGLMGEDFRAGDLVKQVKAMADVKVVARQHRLGNEILTLPKVQPQPGKERGKIELVVIGASTGGPPALQEILKQLSGGIGAPILVVQHISRGFITGMARWLDETVPLPVKVAENFELMRPGTVYLAPDEYHLEVGMNQKVVLKRSPKVDGHRPSVTALFKSAAQACGSAALGVLLTGMGHDGARGLKEIHAKGGYTLAQDEDTCIVFGMPGEAVNMGAVTEIAALQDMGPRIMTLMEKSDEIRYFNR